MSLWWIEIRSMFGRTASVLRRGLTSLRSRGLRASLQRARLHFRPFPRRRTLSRYIPDSTSSSGLTIPASATPRASVVIPVFNHCQHTLVCLRALAEHAPSVETEVIVVDDGSIDDTPEVLSRIDGLRYLRRTANGGFIAACNDGAAIARGQYLVFLNNDTIPQPGWLDLLLKTFEDHPRTGLAGSQLLFLDGRLQEAGGLVFSDGSCANYGRFMEHDFPQYAFVRETDYCSGAAVAIRRDLFQSLGGFDPRFSPAYFEDTDLAFSVRASGLAVMYQPASKVLHKEGTTSGSDPGRGVKAHQARNVPVFREKWTEPLKRHLDPDVPHDVAALRSYRESILIIDGHGPTPDRDSASLRMINLIRILRDEGVHVVFLPTDRRHCGDYTHQLQQLGVEVWYAPFLSGISSWLRENGHRFSTIMACRYHVMHDMLPLLRRYAPNARLVFDSVDLHYLRERRGALISGDSLSARSAETTRALELNVVARSDVTLVVSETEREQLLLDAPEARVEVLSNIHDVVGSRLDFPQRHDLVFVGGFRHAPNEDAIAWFVGEVWPLIRASEPTLKLHCIGGDVTDRVAALQLEPGVVVHGHVPDLRPFMEGARVAIAPLRYGAGVKGKINLSMAHGQPVVATACAVEGMHLTADVDVLVAETAQEFAAAVRRVYHDEALWRRLSEAGLANVQKHFSRDAALEVVRKSLIHGRSGEGPHQVPAG